MRIDRLEHVQLAMPPGGEALARAFYGGVLEIPEIPKPPDLAKRGGCWYALASRLAVSRTGCRLAVGPISAFAPAPGLGSSDTAIATANNSTARSASSRSSTTRKNAPTAGSRRSRTAPIARRREAQLLQLYGIDPLTVAQQCGTSMLMIEKYYFKFISNAMRERLNAIAR
jgi:hypothetical protein